MCTCSDQPGNTGEPNASLSLTATVLSSVIITGSGRYSDYLGLIALRVENVPEILPEELSRIDMSFGTEPFSSLN